MDTQSEPKKQKNKDVGRILLAGFIVVIAGFAASFSIVMIRSMLSPCWLVVACAIILAACLIVPLRKAVGWLTGTSRAWVNILCHMLVVSPLLLAGILLLNRLTPQEGNTHQVTAIVDRVYKETRYRSKRVGRRVYTRGEPYKVNRMDVIFENGSHHSMDISKRLYNSLERGDTVDIPTNMGLLHLTWLEEGNAKPRHERKVRKSCRQVGPRRLGRRINPGSSSKEVMERHRQRIDSLRRKYNRH